MDLLKWWKIEQDSPKWFKDANSLWRENEQDFIAFCAQSHKIYDLGEVIVYVQGLGDKAEIHFGAVPKAKVDISKLIDIRDELFTEFDMIFGWLLKQNRGMKAIAEQVGMKYQGVQMFHGESRGKVLIWHCHSADKNSFIIQ